ncbi:hypothetical protein LT493_42175 [Streptomyces tricolor]|nr:hypothetical protein [Streptomyces tricolor]
MLASPLRPHGPGHLRGLGGYTLCVLMGKRCARERRGRSRALSPHEPGHLPARAGRTAAARAGRPEERRHRSGVPRRQAADLAPYQGVPPGTGTRRPGSWKRAGPGARLRARRR